MEVRSAARLALLLGWAVGCGGEGAPVPRPVEPPLRLLAEPESVAVQPSQAKDVLYRLLNDRDQPVPDRVIQFSIVDDPATPGDDAGGATLSFDRGVTASDGTVSLQIIAGPQATMFRVRASAPRAPDVEVTVFVTTATLAPVEVAPVLVEPALAGQELTTIRLSVLEGDSCAQVRYENLPAGSLFVRTIPSDSTALFSTVNTGLQHHVVALGLDAAGVARAGGCVDLPGSLLLVAVPLRLVVPMHLFRVSAQGTYDVVSRLPLGPAVKSAALVSEAWRELGLCPLDPARLWLDCTIDALATSATDPSDCRPGDDEGLLGRALTGRRGLPVATPGMGACRDRMDAGGNPSLDAIAASLFATPRPRLVEELGALSGEVERLLGSLELRSVLRVVRTSTADEYQVTHRLVSASFPQPPAGTTVDLLELGAPALEARFVSGTGGPSDLQIGTHGFTLRLGTAARRAFGKASLAPRGAPGHLGDFLNALFALAARDDGGTILTGCGALDALLCADQGQARGCLQTACTDGVAALRRRLEGGFLAMDGDDLDFVVGGTVPIIDTDGDRLADLLGSLASHVGLWSGEVRGRGGPSVLTGTWTAVKTGQ
jgi:hypothetical protein